MNTHTCHARDCKRRVAPKLLMCPPHWKAVPAHLKSRVWATYKPGQEITKVASREYLEAAKAAIDAVAAAEFQAKTQGELFNTFGRPSAPSSGEHATTVRACRVCGCTEERGCPEICWWVGPNLCSSCAE